MNRSEILLEALKETDRHVESMLKAARDYASGFSVGKAIQARDEITAAILAENGSTISSQKLRDALEENQRLSDELHAVSEERYGLKAELCDLYDKHIAATKPNPALENVLAKLRSVVLAHPLSERDAIVISMDAGAQLTIGDLRRWIEGEKPLTKDEQAISAFVNGDGPL